MKLLGAVFLCTGLVNLVQGKVVTKDECNQFFVAGQPPTFYGEIIPDENVYRLICQTQNDRDYEYFTLYNTEMKIPLYSAYKFHKRPPGQKITRKQAWKTEPELRDFSDQAVNDDYEGSGYDKGHLYPVNHAHNQKAVDATFTLTNAAPQTCMFNREWYFEVESKVSSELKKCSDGNAYIVTGVKKAHYCQTQHLLVNFSSLTYVCD